MAGTEHIERDRMSERSKRKTQTQPTVAPNVRVGINKRKRNQQRKMGKGSPGVTTKTNVTGQRRVRVVNVKRVRNGNAERNERNQRANGNVTQ